ncbi:MAG: hypothetical protein AAF950_05170 [Pseudomonadota bacterium]
MENKIVPSHHGRTQANELTKSLSPKLSIFDLAERWRSLETTLSQLLNASSSGEDETTIAYMHSSHPVAEEAVLAKEQENVLEQLNAAQAMDLQDVFRKLEIWKAMVAPDGHTDTWLQPSDRLILSVIADLEEFL